jgi:hypothetical protein
MAENWEGGREGGGGKKELNLSVIKHVIGETNTHTNKHTHI